MIDPTHAAEGIQYFLSGSRECESLFGYKKDGLWYANSDGEDYALDSEPSEVCEIGGIENYFDADAELIPTEYQVVELADGRYQIAFLSEKYAFSDQSWHIDVFADALIHPKQRLGRFIGPNT